MAERWSLECFTVRCRACQSLRVVVDDARRVADDGDGRVDRWGGVDLVCDGCGQRETVAEDDA